MLAIGRALMSAPKLLLLDEPSLGLAPKLVEEVLGRIPSIVARGTSVLLAAHVAPHFSAEVGLTGRTPLKPAHRKPYLQISMAALSHLQSCYLTGILRSGISLL